MEDHVYQSARTLILLKIAEVQILLGLEQEQTVQIVGEAHELLKQGIHVVDPTEELPDRGEAG